MGNFRAAAVLILLSWCFAAAAAAQPAAMSGGASRFRAQVYREQKRQKNRAAQDAEMCRIFERDRTPEASRGAAAAAGSATDHSDAEPIDAGDDGNSGDASSETDAGPDPSEPVPTLQYMQNGGWDVTFRLFKAPRADPASGAPVGAERSAVFCCPDHIPRISGTEHGGMDFRDCSLDWSGAAGGAMPGATTWGVSDRTAFPGFSVAVFGSKEVVIAFCSCSSLMVRRHDIALNRDGLRVCPLADDDLHEVSSLSTHMCLRPSRSPPHLLNFDRARPLFLHILFFLVLVRVRNLTVLSFPRCRCANTWATFDNVPRRVSLFSEVTMQALSLATKWIVGWLVFGAPPQPWVPRSPPPLPVSELPQSQFRNSSALRGAASYGCRPATNCLTILDRAPW